MVRKHLTALTLALSIVAALALPTLADGPDAVEWLKSLQNADGGFGSPESSVATTADVLLAVPVTEVNAIEWSEEGVTAYSFLVVKAPTIVSVGELGKVILALVAADRNPRDLGGVDLIAKLEGMLGSDGQYGDSGMINDQAYAMLALASTERPIPAEAVDYLLSKQIADGTWSWNGDTTAGTGDNNTAAMAVLALIAAGVPADHAQIAKTVEHLHAQQNEDGGFPYVKPSPWGTDSDANSTAVVMWALKAAGEDPAGDAWKYEGKDGHSPLDLLRSLQNEDGAFRWQAAIPDDNLMATVQALIALELETLPYATTNVGEAAGGPTTPADPGEPTTLPETGGTVWLSVIALLVGGAALAGTGLRLRRRR